jgi:hypothetical protein
LWSALSSDKNLSGKEIYRLQEDAAHSLPLPQALVEAWKADKLVKIFCSYQTSNVIVF